MNRSVHIEKPATLGCSSLQFPASIHHDSIGKDPEAVEKLVQQFKKDHEHYLQGAMEQLSLELKALPTMTTQAAA